MSYADGISTHMLSAVLALGNIIITGVWKYWANNGVSKMQMLVRRNLLRASAKYPSANGGLFVK